MISKAQRGFITGRDIRENVVLVQSLLQHKIDGVMIFIDWSKAYDRVDYEWLEGNLVAFGFGEKSLRALRTTWRGFDLRVIGINGISEAFEREQGMAQGCPGAPLLFVFLLKSL